MRPSLYILIATLLIKADIQHSLRKEQKKLRAEKVDFTHLSTHLLRDIGLQYDGFDVGERFPAAVQANRKVRYLRHIEYSKINT